MKLLLTIIGVHLLAAFLNAQAHSIKGQILEFEALGTFRPTSTYLMREDGRMVNLWNNTGTDFPKDTSPTSVTSHPSYLESIDAADPSLLKLTVNGVDEVLDFTDDVSGTSSRGLFRIIGIPYSSSAITNVSNRGYVIQGKTCITGFVNSGPENRLFLIRAMGTTLENFGVEATDVATFELYRGQERVALSEPYSGADWEEINKLAGAFPAKNGTHEAILFGFLPPGTYTVVARGGLKAGDILCEIYELGFFNRD